MNIFSIFKRRKPKGPLTITQALDDDRPDIAVSDWLQRAFNLESVNSLPTEVLVAYRVDRFLQEVNSGGFLGFFDFEFDEIEFTTEALRAIKLPKVAEMIVQAIQLVSNADSFDSRYNYDALKDELMDDGKRSAKLEKLDERAMNQSASIESKTYAYVRANLSAFQQFDP